MAPERSHPYLRSIQTTLGAALVAGLVCALYDGVSAGGGGSTLAVVIGLYGVASTVVGLIAGAILGAIGQTFGQGALGRGMAAARSDRELDKNITAAVVAVAAGLLVVAGIIAVGALVLVAGVERKSVGAALLGVAAAASVPIVALCTLPVYRVARRLAAVIPAIGPLPGFVVLLGAGLSSLGLAVFVFVRARLDVEALGLGWLSIAIAYPLLAITAATVGRRLLAERVRVAPILGVGAGLLVGAACFFALGAELDSEGAVALNERTQGARVMAAIGRKLSDGDGDGYSARFGGPDCDDKNPAVHPAAVEILDNGIDDNCVGGDRKSAPTVDGPAQTKVTEPSIQRKDANVLVIAIDTLRSDRLGVTGYRRGDKSLTPRLDALIGESSYFTRIYAQAPNTPRSFPSMFTSRFPSTVKVDKQFKNYSKVLDENVTVFEALQAAKLTTIGYSSHFYFEEGRGIKQGFSRYDNEGAKNIAGSNKDIASPRTVPKAQAELKKLAESKERFALFVHLFEPHSTYLKHEGFEYTERGVPSLVEKYDYEIAFTDRWLGVLLDTLKETGLADNTIVVIVSDHGEAFGVHRVAGKKMFFHGQTLYDELLRVPLIVRVPGLEPRKIETVGMLMDVAPTILDLVGADTPPSMQGRSLTRAMAGKDIPNRFAYGELLPAPSWKHSAKMVVSGDGKHKLIYRLSDRQWELYDLEADPEERKNLYGRGNAAEKPLAEELTRWMEVDLAD